MAITASEITTSNTLEQFRQQFNNLITDVIGLETGTQTFTSLNTTTVNVVEDGTIVFEGATDDAFETTLTVVDPDGDRTVSLPNASGTVIVSDSSTNIVTIPDDLIIKDGGTIGATSAATAITIASTGIVTFVDDILIKDGGTIGAASATTAITIASTGIVTFVDDIVIKDGGTIGSSTTGGAITIAAGGGITTSGELVVGSLLKMPTNTSARILVADGTSYEEVAVSGDVSIDSTGAVTIGANAVEGSMLNTDVISAQTELASGLAETDEILISDAGTLKRTDITNLTEITDGSATALAIALG